MIDLAAETNRLMPSYVVKRIKSILGKDKVQLKGAKILIVGAAYKKDVNDLRESPAIDIIKKLKDKGAKIKYHDTYIPYLNLPGIKCRSCALTASLVKKQDLILIVTDHSNVDYDLIKNNASKIFDTRNIFCNKDMENGNIVKI